MEQLIALVDISGTVKAGDHFEAPDRILVAMGLAIVDDGSEPRLEQPDPAPQRRAYRRRVAS